MRRTLGTLCLGLALAASVLTGCGDSDPGLAPDPAAHSSSATDSAAFEAHVVALLSQTGAGGATSTQATVLGDDAAVADFAGQFTRGSLGDQIRAKAGSARLAGDQTLVAAVVAVGCDVPPGVTVTPGAEGVVITPQKVAKPTMECFAPVTTVALVAVPSSAV